MFFFCDRNLLSYLLLCNREWNSIHLATRCLVVCDSDYQKEEDFRSPIEILGAAAVACYSGGNHSDKLSLPTCRGQCLSGHEAIQRLQKYHSSLLLSMFNVHVNFHFPVLNMWW